jgi:hypothetical protein
VIFGEKTLKIEKVNWSLSNANDLIFNLSRTSSHIIGIVDCFPITDEKDFFKETTIDWYMNKKERIMKKNTVLNINETRRKLTRIDEEIIDH